MSDDTTRSVDAALANAGYPKTSGDIEREQPEGEPHLARGPDQPSAPTEAEGEGEGYEDRTVEDLRDELRTRELPTSGTKPELIQRLQDNDAGT